MVFAEGGDGSADLSKVFGETSPKFKFKGTMKNQGTVSPKIRGKISLDGMADFAVRALTDIPRCARVLYGHECWLCIPFWPIPNKYILFWGK